MRSSIVEGSVSRYRVITLLVIIAAAVLIMIQALNQVHSDGDSVRGASTAPSTPSAPQVRADLAIQAVRIERHADSALPYQVFATIANWGEHTASGFAAGCTYQCPGGGPSGGMDIIRYGYLEAQSHRTFRQPFQFTCAEPPAEIDLVCEVDWHGDIAESDELNNSRRFSLSAP